ncbi:hypothetical protein KSC_023940 [Ktedonobacter sp. SOSP1-52]|uniref:hypothetical protein n=1 Tax=Ktedonobacter sp. SOSP1-52 TaxID=2778366 RepID=UPI0019165F86|nr:hypothetical protein [Ktedonobacter sp. SOSP1-52]GHO63502.1 hypothetical protein KSC_023940 [Ktedonobacter sp. SOSP1-52]
MSDVPGIPNSAFQWEARNKLANEVIAIYAQRHKAMDITVGLGSGVIGIFVPVASFAGLAGALVAAIPVIYNPLTQKLAYIYKASPDKITKGMKASTIIEETVYDVGAELLFDFTTDFLVELITEMWPQLFLGLGASLIPFAGLAANAVLDGIIASTLTWRLGTMTAIYYMNGENWLYSNKKRTRREANKLTGFPSADIHRPDALSHIKDIPEVMETNVEKMLQTAKFMKEANPDITNAQLREIFRKQSLPEKWIEEVLRRLSK